MSFFNRLALKRKAASFFSRFFLSKDKSKELKNMVGESEAIYKRLSEQEQSIREMNQIILESNQAIEKKIDAFFSEVKSLQEQQEKTFQKQLKTVLKGTAQTQRQLEKSFESRITGLEKDISKHSAYSKQLNFDTVAKVDLAVGQITSVSGAITGIRDYLEENSNITRRFQEGYDYHILKNFVRQITRTIKNLDGFISELPDGRAKEEYVNARDDLVELLELNSIEQINPEIGSSRERLEKEIAVVEDRVGNNAPERSGKIGEVVQTGYKFVFNEDQERILIPAQVKLFE